MISPDLVAAFDTETHPFSPGNQFPRLVCGSFTTAEGTAVLDRASTFDFAKALLASQAVITGVNLAYDFGVLCFNEPEFWPLVFDKFRRDQITGIDTRQRLADNAKGWLKFHPEKGKMVKSSYGLAGIAHRYGFQVEKEDTPRLRYHEVDGVPISGWPQEHIDYAAKDTQVPWQIFQTQEQNEAHWLADQYRQERGAWWLRLASGIGLTTDLKQVQAYITEVEKDIELIRGELIRYGLLRYDGSRNTKQAERLMSVAPNPQPKLDADACELSGQPLLVKYAEYSGLQTKLSRARELAPGLIHTYFVPMLESGRVSSQSPNVMNRKRDSPEHWPKHVGDRQCFIARPGYVLAIADYSSAEMSALAQICYSWFGRSKLRDLINSGRCPHVFMASEILGVTFSDAEERYAAGDKEVKNARQLAKIPDFGIPGGLGATALVDFARKTYGITITEARAKELIAIYFRAFPEMRKYFARINKMLAGRKEAVFETLNTQRFVKAHFTKACNNGFQALISDVAKLAGFLIAEACFASPGNPLYGSRIVNFGHDEFQVEVPEGPGMSAAAFELQRLMVAAGKVYVPDVRLDAEPLLAYHWGKQNKPVFDSAGNLIPCDTREMPRL